MRRLTLAAAILLAGPVPLEAQQTFTVTSTADVADATPGDGACDTGSGSCTLRAAIEEANATAGHDTIAFAIAGSGPHTIQPGSNLPAVTDPVVIDGFTQAGASPNTNGPGQGVNAVWMVVLDAGNTSGTGFRLDAANSTIRGLRIQNAPDVAIRLVAGDSSTIAGNDLILQPASDGVVIETSGNVVGGTTPAARNVIGGGQYGVRLNAGAGNRILGNLIGTDAAGTAGNGNGLAGMLIASGSNVIGGATAAAANVISANQDGILIDGVSVDSNEIRGNLIGTGVTGAAPLGNTGHGIAAEDGLHHVIADNVISGNGTTGVYLVANADSAVVTGNFIGVNAAGTAAVPNGTDGILYTSDAPTIGGAAAGEGNVIAGNTATGIVGIGDRGVIRGNLIGTDATGTQPLGNDIGISIQGGLATIVGGLAAGEGNVIAASSSIGVAVSGASGGTQLLGNFIGTDASGTLNLGNGQGSQSGVRSTSSSVLIEGNIIAHSGDNGVEVAVGTNNEITGNAIFDNAGLGIDLEPSGVTPNDAGDGDTGANQLQNFPLVTLAYLDGGTVVRGTLNSQTNGIYRLEFFANDACDPSDHGEGRVFLGSTTVAADGAGNATFEETLATTAVVGQVVTATATNISAVENTSEFSPCARVHAQPMFVVTATDDVNDGVCSDGHCSLREAILAANARPGTDAIHFDIPGAGPHVIQPATLPTITDPVVIDGYTQPGTSPNTNGPAEGTNAVLQVVLDASGTNGSGLDITAGSSTVRGLVIHNAGDWAVSASGNGGNTIEGNFLGTDRLATNAVGQSFSVVRLAGPDNTVGGTAPAARNVIGSGGRGVQVQPGATGTVIQGNLIGVGANGGTVLNVQFRGIEVAEGGTRIGGTTAGAGNVVSGGTEGIAVVAGVGTVIQGNRIGTDVTGTLPRGNQTDGIVVLGGATETVIGGPASGAANVIAGNGGRGIRIQDAGSDATIVQGNLIGTDITGAAALPNGTAGVQISDVSNTIVGGVAAGEGNTIAFNGGDGVVLLVFAGTGNTIRGNRIHANGGLGIALGTEGVTANDAGDGDAGPNGFQNFPVIDVALLGSAELEGTLNSAPNATYTIDFYSNDACNASGHGEGQRFLGTTTVSTDGSGDAAFAVSLTGPASPGDAVTATATDAAGSTSEFSACLTGNGFVTSASADTVAVVRGGSGALDVTVTAQGSTFDRDVTLSCQGLPAGATCQFSPATVQPGAGAATASLTVSTSDPDTPAGPHDFTIVGTYGSIDRTFDATLAVTDFTVAVAPASATTAPGGTATYTVTVDPDGGSFGDPVALACAGLPAQASCGFAPAQVTPGTSGATSALTISTAAATPTGTASVTVTGTAGALARSGDTELVVGDFTIAVSPAADTVRAGESAVYTVSVMAEGGAFAADVALGCANLPTGLSCDFSPAAVTPGAGTSTSTLTLSGTAMIALRMAAGGDVQHAEVPWGLPLALALLVAAGIQLRRGRPRGWLAAAAVGVLLAGLACAGEATAPGDPVTVTFTVTGTAGTVTHDATASVTVR